MKASTLKLVAVIAVSIAALAVLLNMIPTYQPTSASLMYRPHSALVHATYAMRRSSSSIASVSTCLLGNMPSFTPHTNTYGNSRPFAVCMVIIVTESLSFSLSLFV